jgi:uncharacterized membrane protein YfcA
VADDHCAYTVPLSLAAALEDDIALLALMAFAMLGTGLVAGVLAGLLGVGGGIVMVPALYLIFGIFDVDQAVRMHMAVGTSLAAMIPTSIRSALAHRKRGAVDGDLFRAWMPPVMVGAAGGSLLAPHAPSTALRGIFSVFALLVAINMLAGNARWNAASELPGLAWQRVAAGLIAGVSVMMGIGGGTFTVPYLSLFGYPIRRAVATSAAIGVLIAIPGAMGFCIGGLGVPARPHGSLGFASTIGCLLIVPATMIATPWGAAMTHRIDPRWLRCAFALFLALTGLRMGISLLF